MIHAEVQCVCGTWERIERPEENPCAVEFTCFGCMRLIRVTFTDVLESPALEPPPSDTPATE
jgi:hypothetical protein